MASKGQNFDEEKERGFHQGPGVSQEVRYMTAILLSELND